MKVLIFLLIPFALFALNIHLAFPDPVGFHLYCSGQYAVIFYTGLIAIAALSRRKGPEMYREVFPLLILVFFQLCLIWLIVEEMAGLNQWDFAFTRVRFIIFAGASLVLTAFSAFRLKRLKDLEKIQWVIRPGTVYMFSYLPGSAWGWLGAIFFLSDHSGRGFILDGNLYMINKATGEPEVKAVDPGLLRGKLKELDVKPGDFRTAWYLHSGQSWRPWNNCRTHCRKVIRAANAKKFVIDQLNR